MNPDRSGVLCVGMALVDIGKVIDAYPALDHLAIIEETSLSTGGSALNLPIDLRQLGARFPIELMAAIGDDVNGAYILSECKRLDIDTTNVQVITTAVTSFTDVMVEQHGGRRTFFHHPGANAHFHAAPDDVRQSAARIAHFGAPGLHQAMDRTADGRNGWEVLIQAAGELGMHTNLELASVEAGRLREVVLPCLPYVDSIIINEIEASALVGADYEAPAAGSPPDWQALTDIARGLVERGVRTLAVVHVPAGSVAVASDGRVWTQGSVRLSPAEVRGTTGAGDAFAAGVLLGLHDGLSIDRCLLLGAASAAACIMSPHTSAGIGPAEQCLERAEQLGFRPSS